MSKDVELVTSQTLCRSLRIDRESKEVEYSMEEEPTALAQDQACTALMAAGQCMDDAQVPVTLGQGPPRNRS